MMGLAAKLVHMWAHKFELFKTIAGKSMAGSIHEKKDEFGKIRSKPKRSCHGRRAYAASDSFPAVEQVVGSRSSGAFQRPTKNPKQIPNPA